MHKRLLLISSVLLPVGMIAWLSLGQSSLKDRLTEYAQTRIARGSGSKSVTLGEDVGDLLPRESPRHASGELEVSKSLEFKRKQRDLEAKKALIAVQIDTLSKYEGMQLYAYAASLELPQNAVREVLPKYLEAMRGLDLFKRSGFGSEHPSVKDQVEKIAELNRELDDNVTNLRKTLSMQSGVTR